MSRSEWPYLLGSVLLAGCSSVDTGTKQRSADLQSSTVTCDSRAECDALWKRAESWVRKHSYWPIRMRTDTVIETDRPRARRYWRTHYRVTRTPTNDGAVIRLQARCERSIYCAPDPQAAQLAFHRYLVSGQDRDGQP